MSWYGDRKLSVISMCLAIMIAATCLAQSANEATKDETAELTKRLDKLETITKRLTDSSASVIHLAVGLGVRFIYDKKQYFGDPSISPIDSTLQIDNRDRGAVILSGVVMATPFKASRNKLLSGLGFVANVNLAEISGENINTLNNQSIEGGLGIAFRLQSNFALAVTYELVFSRRLRDHVLQRQGEKVFTNGKVLTEINRENNNLFIDDNLNGFSVKFIYHFGK